MLLMDARCHFFLIMTLLRQILRSYMPLRFHGSARYASVAVQKCAKLLFATDITIPCFIYDMLHYYDY